MIAGSCTSSIGSYAAYKDSITAPNHGVDRSTEKPNGTEKVANQTNSRVGVGGHVSVPTLSSSSSGSMGIIVFFCEN